VPAIVTKQFRVRNAKDFKSRLLGPSEGGSNAYDGVNYIYLSFGKVVPWDETNFGSDDTNPPDPDGDVSTLYDVYRDGLAASRLDTDDVSLGIRRYDWTSGTVYSQYDDQDPTITNGTAVYFVYEPNTGDIFKCLDNNNGGASTVRPTQPIAGLIEQSFITSDGYRWKFMAQTSIADRKFLTTNFAPIRSLNVHPSASVPAGYELQHDVQSRANTGTIETYVVSSGGAGYTKHSGAVTDRTISGAGTSATRFTLSADSALDTLPDDHFNGATIFVDDGSGTLESGLIDDYTGSTTREVFLDAATPLSYTPAGGETYHIAPTVWVSGDGSGANAYAIFTSTGSLSQVNALNTANTGNSYTFATVTVDPLGRDVGSAASVRAIIPPQGGHGNDPADELNGFNVLLNQTINAGGAGNTYPVANDYRVVSLIRSPLLANGYNQDVLVPATSGANWFANTETVHMSTWLVCNTTTLQMGQGPDPTDPMQVFTDWNSGAGPLPDDEVEGVNSGAKGRVVEFNSDGRGILNITNVVANTTGGTFLDDEAIRLTRTYTGFVPTTNNYVVANGFSLGFTADPYFDVLQVGELQSGTGEVLYVENRQPILRSVEQRETVTIVIEF
jgi:hypothetical protein